MSNMEGEALHGKEGNDGELNEYFGATLDRISLFGAITQIQPRNKSGKRFERAGISAASTK